MGGIKFRKGYENVEYAIVITFCSLKSVDCSFIWNAYEG